MHNLLLLSFSVDGMNAKIASKKIKIFEQFKHRKTENKLHSVKHLLSISFLFENTSHKSIKVHKLKVKRIDHKSFIKQNLFIKYLQVVKSSNQSSEKLNFLLQIHRVGKTIVSGNNRFQYNYR